jgi:nicotinate-nucleotide adenylyltransferase
MIASNNGSKVKLAVEDERGMKASDYEFHMARPYYTINTLNSLKSDYPEHNFKLLLGGDNLTIMHRWYRFDEIVDQFGLIVYPRPGYAIEEFKNTPNIQVIDAPLLDISATGIRKRIENNESIEGLVPNKVIEYLKNKKYS